MKANRIIKLLLLFCFSISSLLVKAQQENKCLATKVDMKEYMKMVQLERSGKNFAPATPIVIRVFFRVCDPDGGKLFDITEDQINTDFKHLVGAYAADNICFINAGYDHIFNTALDTFNT